jgi:hypothetical protein
MKVKYYTDPGHGWIAVKRSLLADWGILNQVSTYSYQRGGTVYLEEDCDAGLFFNAARAQGIQPELIERNTPERRHVIRSYDHFSTKI